MAKNGSTIRKMSELIFTSASTKVTDAEVEYFRDHPGELDEVAAPVTVHLIFLWLGTLLGLALVGLSKVLQFSGVLDVLTEGGSEFVVDVVFEIGVALIGGAVTAYLLGILLNQQQRDVTTWRTEVRRRIDEETGAD